MEADGHGGALVMTALADHSTAYAAEMALQTRLLFKVGPYEGRQIPGVRSMAFVRTGNLLPGSCACGRIDCAVDQLEADMKALADVPGDDADEQLFLAWEAFRVARKACDEAVRS